MDVGKHIAHWRKGAEEDFEVARELVEMGRLRHGLFWVHLAVEKMLKAHVTRATEGVPPKVHNLVRLLELSGLTASEDQRILCQRLNAYQMDGRYPQSASDAALGTELAHELLDSTKGLLEWLTAEL